MGLGSKVVSIIGLLYVGLHTVSAIVAITVLVVRRVRKFNKLLKHVRHNFSYKVRPPSNATHVALGGSPAVRL